MVTRRAALVGALIVLCAAACGGTSSPSGPSTSVGQPTTDVDWIRALDGVSIDAPAGTTFVRAKADGSALAYLSAFDGELIVFDAVGQRRVTVPDRHIESFDWDPTVDCGWLVVVRSDDDARTLERLGCEGTAEDTQVDLPRGRATFGLATIGDATVVVAIESGGSPGAIALARVDLTTGERSPLTTSDGAVRDGHPVAVDDSSIVFVRSGHVDKGVQIGRLDLNTGEIEWVTTADRVSAQPFVIRGSVPELLYVSYTPGVDRGRSAWRLPLDASTPIELDAEANFQPAAIDGVAVLQLRQGDSISLVVRDLPAG